MRVKLSDITKYSKGVQINGNDLIEDGEYIYLNGGISPSGRWDAANVCKNTITISEGGNSSGYINYIEEPFWCGAHCYYLFDGPPNTKYLYYALKSQQERLFRLRSGACMPNIKKADLGQFEFEFDYDKKRQDSVVVCLDKARQIIEARQRELQSLDELIKARFIEMFGDHEHPNVELIDVIKEGAGLSYGIVQPGDDGTGDMGVLRPVDLVDGTISTKSIKYINRSISDGFRKTELTGDELLITVRGTTGITALTDERFKGMNVTRGIAVIRYDRCMIDPVYLNAYLNTIESQRYISDHTRGATLQQINLSDLRIMRIKIPPMETQKSFAAIAKQIDKSKFAVQKALDEAQLLFENLMQKYFG